MAKHAWIALIGLAMAQAGTLVCLADDEPPNTDDAVDTTPNVTTIDELLKATAYADVNFAPIALGTRPDLVDVPRIAIDLEDNSMFGRLRRERSLYFLTLSNQRRSRLFLGINDQGYFGLHLTGKSDED